MVEDALINKIARLYQLEEYRLFRYQNVAILSDPSTQDESQVFFPYLEEVNLCAPFYTRGIKQGDRVLELGAGSGLYSILAALKGGEVVGVDINPRAVRFAQINREINGLAEQNPTFIVASMEEYLLQNQGVLFDRIIASLPYKPWPAALGRGKVYSNGGELGRAFSKIAIGECPKRLKRNGSFLIYTMSLGDEKRSWLETQSEQLFAQRDGMTAILTKVDTQSADFFAWFASHDNSGSGIVYKWVERLCSLRLTHMHYLMLEVKNTPGSSGWSVRQKKYDPSIAYPASRNSSGKSCKILDNYPATGDFCE
jgi:SAM-dependent methyltransferase